MAQSIGAMCARLYAMEQKWRGGMERAVSDAAGAACGVARELVPVDTGRLRASIGVRAEGLGAAVYATAAYALYVELGAGSPAQPYLGPAFQRAAAELLAAAREVIV
ncbi:MAG: HK97 gp10 family phage protein [Clostridiales bacterium]|nr:HK97 gp10 family phage protein [Clostridiales bacterium]